MRLDGDAVTAAACLYEDCPEAHPIAKSAGEGTCATCRTRFTKADRLARVLWGYTPDVEVTWLGAIVELHLRTPAARKWVSERAWYSKWQLKKDTLTVEPRYVEALFAGMQGGLKLPWNPRYLAYCAATGASTPDEALARDRERWPGGCMTGYITWINAQWEGFAKSVGIPRRVIELQLGFDVHARFDAWLREQLS